MSSPCVNETTGSSSGCSVSSGCVSVEASPAPSVVEVSDLPSVVTPCKSSVLFSVVTVPDISSFFSEETSVVSSVVSPVSPPTFVPVSSSTDCPLVTASPSAVVCASQTAGFSCAETYLVPIGVFPAANAIDNDTANALLMFFLIISSLNNRQKQPYLLSAFFSAFISFIILLSFLNSPLTKRKIIKNGLLHLCS